MSTVHATIADDELPSRGDRHCCGPVRARAGPASVAAVARTSTTAAETEIPAARNTTHASALAGLWASLDWVSRLRPESAAARLLRSEMTSATIHTSEGPIQIELFPADVPKTVENFHHACGRRLLRRACLPSGDPGLHGPGRLPTWRRHRRARVTSSTTSRAPNRLRAVRSRWRTPGRTRTGASSSS